MFKSFIVFGLFLLTFSAFSQDEQPRHMVTFGNSFNTGWSGEAAKADVDSSLGIDELDVTEGNFNINYAYCLAPQFQLGINIMNTTSTSEVKMKAGGKVKSEDNNSSVVLFGIINFSERLNDAFYLALGVGKAWNEETSKDTTVSPIEDEKTKSDQNIYTIGFGKRFNLKFAGIENLTYSPSISYQHSKIGGDLEDTGVNSVSSFTLDIVKFDLLF